MSVLKAIRRSISLLLLLVTVQANAQAPADEFQLKAVFVYNFTQFVEWPDEAFVSSGSSFVIGIVGNDPFGKHLKEIVNGERVNGRPIVIKQFDSVEDIGTCHLLYINSGDNSFIKSALKRVRGKNVLTVSDAENFGSLGGIIRIYKRSGKISMQINLDAAREENLSISVKLLRLAEIVKKE